MPLTPFTAKEKKYIWKLKDRNIGLVKKRKATEKLYCSPLEKPMSANERQMRTRIRKKALHSTAELIEVWRAGILPQREGAKSMREMVKDMEVVYTWNDLEKLEKKASKK